MSDAWDMFPDADQGGGIATLPTSRKTPPDPFSAFPDATLKRPNSVPPTDRNDDGTQVEALTPDELAAKHALLGGMANVDALRDYTRPFTMPVVHAGDPNQLISVPDTRTHAPVVEPETPLGARVAGDVLAGVSEAGSDVAGLGRGAMGLMARGLRPDDQSQLDPVWRQRYQTAADYLQSGADDIGTAQGVVKHGYEGEHPTLDTRIAEGLGDTAATLIPGAGMPTFGAKIFNDAQDAYHAQHPDATQADLDAAGDDAIKKNAPMVAAFMAAGPVAGGLSKYLTPEEAGLARQYATHLGVNTATNVGVGSGIRALQGDDWRPTPEGFLTADLPFAIHSTFGHATEPARPESPKVVEPPTTPQPQDFSRPEAQTPTATQAEPATSLAPETARFQPGPRPPDSAPDNARQQTTPIFADGATPEQRAENFLSPDEGAIPTAVRFAPDETVPDELAHLPAVETPDGGKIVYDPEAHSAPPEQKTRELPSSESLLTDDYRRQLAEANQAAANERAQRAEKITSEPTRAPETDEERQARREYEASLVGDYGDASSTNGHELLTAIQKAGGLPTPGSDTAREYRGELRNALEMSKGGRQVGVKGVFAGKLFRTDAPHPDDLATSLRDYGFNVQTPSDVFDLLDQRLRTGKAVYGQPEAAGTFARQQRRPMPEPDLLSRITEDLKLVGERGVDHGARQAEAEAAAQAKADAQRAQDSQQGSLFARKQVVSPEDKNLVVTHNLSQGNLRHALKMGGLPVPSLAVI